MELNKQMRFLGKREHKVKYDMNRNQKANMNSHKENKELKRELVHLQADLRNVSLQL